MTYQDLNQYILHYMTEDKTKSAIMLTAPWGTGKSYYIQNELIPFLEKRKEEKENGKWGKKRKGKENENHKCIVVSLYGLKDLFDVSKALYLESRAKLLNNASEKAVAGKLVAKTIIKGVTSFFSVDLSKSDSEMRELFESIDLSGKLIIIEDLERSGIDIIEVLGYVNNLVEQDGVKVLLVANEEEIIQYKPIEHDTQNGQEMAEIIDRITDYRNRAFTDSTLMYFKVKEKTISDTIQFEEDYQAAIQEIIRDFDNETLNKFSNVECIKDIFDIMILCNSCNLRSFIFACQKASEIFKKLEDKYLSDDVFIKAIYFGILFFVLKHKAGQACSWGQEKYFSIELGHENAPLFKFCYDYIVSQSTDFSELDNAYQSFFELVLYDQNRSNDDNDILTLRTYQVQTESDIINALSNIEKRLETPEDISFYQYGNIAVYVVLIKDILEYDIKKIEDLLVKNIRGIGDKLQLEQIFRTIPGDKYTQQQREEYEVLRKRMVRSLKIGNSVIPNFDYQPEQSNDFYNYTIQNRGKFHIQESFAAQLDMKRLSEMFKNSTAAQKQQIRYTFTDMYQTGIIRSTFANDKESIEQLLKIVKNDRMGDVGDAIQRLQYDWFIHNLEEILEKLS